MSYSLDPDQARQTGPNCLQQASAYGNSGQRVKATAKIYWKMLSVYIFWWVYLKKAQIRLLHCRSSPISHCLSKRLLKHFSRWQNLSILVCFLHYFYLEHSILVISWPFRHWLDLIPIFSWNMSSWKVNLRIFTPIILFYGFNFNLMEDDSYDTYVFIKSWKSSDLSNQSWNVIIFSREMVTVIKHPVKRCQKIYCHRGLD